jgi:hypothetical protein
MMKSLMTRDPKQRLGGSESDAQEVKDHPFFRGVDWEKFLQKKVKPPFLPRVVRVWLRALRMLCRNSHRRAARCLCPQKSPKDTSNFEAEFTRQAPKLTPPHTDYVLTKKDQQLFANFSYRAEWAQ